MKTLQLLILFVLFAFQAEGAAPRSLYYTYAFENDQTIPKAGAFFDSLPDGLVWDTNYTPVTTGSLSVDVVYSNGNRDARIDKMMIPPGKSSLTLCTTATSMTGTIDNDATVTPIGGETIDAQASLDIGDVKYGDIRMALLIDESGSIDATETAQIRAGLDQFFDQELGSGNLISLIGMSEGPFDIRTDHVVETKLTAATKPAFDAWVNDYQNGRVGAQADYVGFAAFRPIQIRLHTA